MEQYCAFAAMSWHGGEPVKARYNLHGSWYDKHSTFYMSVESFVTFDVLMLYYINILEWKHNNIVPLK